MMSRINPVLSFISHNRYWFVIIIGGLLVGVIDDNSFLTRAQYAIQIRDLKEEIEKYNGQYERDKQKLNELHRNPKAITKIARENYMMKADDEDIFVLSDDEKNNETEDETTE
ncbi:MAG TPA: septum formation initiator [Prevotella sp.]|nr:septum formation initiator [Prevotella sp.]